VREKLQKIVGPAVTILDSNEPVAQQVKRVLPFGASGGLPEYTFYATKDIQNFEAVDRSLVGDIVKNVQLVVL